MWKRNHPGPGRQAGREGSMEHETWLGLGRRFGISLGNEQKDRFHNVPNTRMTDGPLSKHFGVSSSSRILA